MDISNYMSEDLRAASGAVWSALNDSELASVFMQSLDMLLKCYKAKGKVLVCGNGGSAADAEHLAGELVGRFAYSRPPLPCVTLCTPSAVFTAISNDYGYENTMARMFEAHAEKNDVLIGFSTSGNSPNIVKAFEAAKQMNVCTIAFTGHNASKLSDIADLTFKVPSTSTPRIQEIHGIIIHSLCRAVERGIFPNPDQIALPENKIIKPDTESVEFMAKAIKKSKSVFTNGCFDILHPGHVMLLKDARKMGDLLIVGLNTDSSIKRLKGETRPYHTMQDRAEVLAALSCVDYIIPFDEDTPERLIKALTPSVLVKGGDYTVDTVVGADWVQKHGGKVEIIPLLQGHSTTAILKNEKKS